MPWKGARWTSGRPTPRVRSVGAQACDPSSTGLGRDVPAVRPAGGRLSPPVKCSNPDCDGSGPPSLIHHGGVSNAPSRAMPPAPGSASSDPPGRVDDGLTVRSAPRQAPAGPDSAHRSTRATDRSVSNTANGRQTAGNLISTVWGLPGPEAAEPVMYGRAGADPAVVRRAGVALGPSLASGSEGSRRLRQQGQDPPPVPIGPSPVHRPEREVSGARIPASLGHGLRAVWRTPALG
jgi:hypothetical protein